MKTVVWTLALCGSVVITGCGQKGALYLPDKNASVVTRPAGAGANSPATTPAPAQPQQPQDKDKSDDDSKPKN